LLQTLLCGTLLSAGVLILLLKQWNMCMFASVCVCTEIVPKRIVY
jgi:hypothetical protein